MSRKAARGSSNYSHFLRRPRSPESPCCNTGLKHAPLQVHGGQEGELNRSASCYGSPPGLKHSRPSSTSTPKGACPQSPKLGSFRMHACTNRYSPPRTKVARGDRIRFGRASPHALQPWHVDTWHAEYTTNEPWGRDVLSGSSQRAAPRESQRALSAIYAPYS